MSKDTVISQSFWLDRAKAVGNLANKRSSMARAQRWSLAAVCAKVVGKYDRGATARLSAQCGTSADVVERMAGAYITFVALWQADPRRAWRCRQQFGYMRWYRLGKRAARYDLTADECFEYIESDLCNVAMELHIADQFDALPEWHRRAARMRKALGKLSTDDAPDRVRGWALAGLEIFESEGVQHVDD